MTEQLIKAPPATLSMFATAAVRALSEQNRTAIIVGHGMEAIERYEKKGLIPQILKRQEEYTLHKEVRTRLRILRDDDITIRYVIVFHEEDKRKPPRLLTFEKVTDVASDILPILGTILEVLAFVLGSVLTIGFAVVLFLIRVDPVVLVCLSDGSVLEIANWYE